MNRPSTTPLLAPTISVCAWLALLAIIALPAAAQLTTVQNDSIATVAPTGAIQAGFVAGESAAAWLTSPCDGNIVTAQILWLSLTGGAPNSLQEAVRIYEAGIFPVPGAQRVDLPGPVLADGFFNEFTLPAPLPVLAGEEFVVELQFLTTPSGLGPSVVTDIDGCQAGKNGIFAIPPSTWFSSCLLGVGGDFGIRAVVNCGATAVPIFADGFETGNTSAWSVVVP